MVEVPNINPQAFDEVSKIASSSHDRPVLMLNLNTYFHGQSTMSSDAYKAYNSARIITLSSFIFQHLFLLALEMFLPFTDRNKQS